ncbi:hypothetical protein V498_10120, partial [Pseudogymnoascus sp. VKM F-4517 (FW-2822)]
NPTTPNAPPAPNKFDPLQPSTAHHINLAQARRIAAAMGWFDGASEAASSYILDGYGGTERRASPSRSSRHGGSKKHRSHKSHKTETGSSFGDWAAGVSGGGAPRHGASKSTTSFFSAPVHAQQHPHTAAPLAAASLHAPTPASATSCASSSTSSRHTP